MGEDSESRAESPVLLESRKTQSQCSLFHILLSVIVVVMAVVVSYMITISSKTDEAIPDVDPSTKSQMPPTH